jgi:3'-phosphoadenosine 5'-phosphosulfate sulfotransferase (PAPS reductase)/FAD synthetase
MPDTTHHIMGLSGGKDSAALAILLRDRVPNIQYFFCDTGAELPETYEFLTKLEAYFGKRIIRLNSGRDFDHWLDVYRGTLPSPQVRWCTRQMKIKPLEDWIQSTFGSELVVSYVAIRSDEPNREGYLSTKPNVEVRYPFREAGIDKAGVMTILDEAGVGLPAYYEWRTRSGCYFCFFQRKAEWVGLSERHPELFERAIGYEEKVNRNHAGYGMRGRSFSWSQGETLGELVGRKVEILAKHEVALRRSQQNRKNVPLIDLLSDALDDDDDTLPCQICNM